jgi:hypothetical protein
MIQKRRHKYGAKPVILADGVRVDSKGEARWYAQLELRQRAGEIADLRRQVRIPLVVNGAAVCVFVADAVWVEAGVERVADYKGVDNPVAILKRKLAAALGVQIELAGPLAARKAKKAAQRGLGLRRARKPKGGEAAR